MVDWEVLDAQLVDFGGLLCILLIQYVIKENIMDLNFVWVTFARAVCYYRKGPSILEGLNP